MSYPDAQRILSAASGKLTPESAPATLSSILHVFFRHRLQPLDPGYVSEHACQGLLKDHPMLYTLLEQAISEQSDSRLRDCDLLAFRGVDLRTCRPLSDSAIAAEKDLNALLDRYRSAISTFARSRSSIETWTPHETDSLLTFLDFIRSLGIIDTHSDGPCLLLHDLDKVKSLQTSDILRKLFSPGQHVIFINASGTGKTRLVLEGLSLHWGFYIPCVLDGDNLGSMDMPECLDTGMSIALDYRRFEPRTDLDMLLNRRVAQKALSRILLSRLIIFRIFLDALDDKESSLAPLHWLLFQILSLKQPRGDIFDYVTTVLERFDHSYINGMIADNLLHVKARLDQSRRGIFCVLDDCHGAFGRNSTLLRELIRPWEDREGITLILAGTDIELDPFLTPSPGRFVVHTQTGLFDTPDSQLAYLRRYLPSTLADTEVGKELAARAWRWLRGRYVFLPLRCDLTKFAPRYCFTVSFVKCLLKADFAEPLILLDAFIARLMGIDPPHVSSLAIEALPKSSSTAVYTSQEFIFTLLNGDVQTWLAGQSALWKIALTGDDQVQFANPRHGIVSHGLAPFVDDRGKGILLHEPTVVLRLMNNIFPKSEVTAGFYPDPLTSLLEEPPTHYTYHLTLVPILVQALSERAHRLCDLFDFPGIPPEWATQTAKLARVTRVGPSQAPRATIFRRPLASMRRDDAWATESPEWLSHASTVPFCLASRFSHADLLFTMRTEGGRCLYVALATMFKNRHVGVDPGDIQTRLSQLAPKKIFKLGRTRSTSKLHFGDLSKKVEEAGDPPLLRLVATYPYDMDINEIDGDAVAQPYAAVNTTLLREYAHSVDIQDVLRRLKNVMTVPRPSKRKPASAAVPGDDSDQPLPRSATKRQKREPSTTRSRRESESVKRPRREGARAVAAAAAATAGVSVPPGSRRRR
ncbi:hypothetical protein HDZ31DRAFT_83586 [Schizophyllum fasciatum]